MTSLEKSKFFWLISPNNLSIMRGLLALVLPFLIMSEDPFHHGAAAWIFTFAAFTDLFDGKIARKFNLESSFGRFIDPLTDKLLILICLWSFSQIGYYSIWWIVPIFMREIFITFCRFGWMIEGQSVGAERLGKWKFGMQVALVGFSLWHLLSFNYAFFKWSHPPFYLGLKISLVVAVLLTWFSGVTFLWNQRKHLETPFFAKFVNAMGVGLIKWAPGTWGSLLALGIVILTGWNPWLFWGHFLFFLYLGYWAYKRMDLTEKDPGSIVMDEVMGIFVTFIAVPLTATNLLIGFGLFRLFDILKPLGLRKLEKFPGYTGVLMDDVGAGIVACIILHSLQGFLS